MLKWYVFKYLHLCLATFYFSRHGGTREKTGFVEGKITLMWLGKMEKISQELGVPLTFIPNAGHFNTKAEHGIS